MHRLNRTEYGNAIRDLLALDINVDELLPSDGANYGFDNIAASLRTSPLLLERYLLVAQRVSTMAVGDKNTPPGSTEYGISREFTQLAHIDGLPIGTRGGTAGAARVPRRRLLQAVRPAGARRRGRLRRRRGPGTARDLRHHRGRRGSVLGRDRRSEGPRGAGQGHERGQEAGGRADDRARASSPPARTTSATPGRIARRTARTSGCRRCATARKCTWWAVWAG